jgi:ATP-binding cassette subfamily B multidrug efflux pump
LALDAGEIGIGAVATALPMAWQIANISGWVAFNVTSIFENIGVVQEAMDSIAVPPTAPDPPGAVPLRVPRGEIRFEGVRFGYGREDRACWTGWTSASGRASASGSWATPAPASPPW